MSDSLYQETSELYSKFVMGTYAPKLLLTRGEGSYVWDSEGRRYLDFASGISVCNLGHCHPKVTSAICSQAAKLVHVSNLYMNEVQCRLAEKLASKGFAAKSFFANSGAEANEGMIKFARKWGSDKDRYGIIAMNNSFHGRTLATLAATGRSKYRKGFGPDMPGFSFADFNDPWSVEKLIDEHTVAIMVEPIQGEGGVMPAQNDFLHALRQLCDENGLLLLFDEVQCGVGRTGSFYAWQSYGVEPDALSMAKALGNGFPIGAFMVAMKHADTLKVGEHASTFGGTPLACAAACAVLDAIDEENVLDNCRETGRYMAGKLNEIAEKHKLVKNVRGRGLMVGVELDQEAGPLLPKLLEEKLIALTAGENVLRLLPPLNVTAEQVDFALDAIDRVLGKTESAK